MLTDYFHKKYYSDLPKEVVHNAIHANAENYNKAVDFIHKKHYANMDKNDFYAVLTGKKPIPKDNTNVANPVFDLRSPVQKKLDNLQIEKQNKIAKEFQSVIAQTALDQNDKGKNLNTLSDINDIKNYDNEYLGFAAAMLNDAKTSLPVVGDFFVNTLQEAAKYFDNEYKEKIDKSSLDQKTKDKIKNKPFGVQNQFN